MTAAAIEISTDNAAATATPRSELIPTEMRPRIEMQTVTPAKRTDLPEVSNDFAIESRTDLPACSSCRNLVTINSARRRVHRSATD